MTTREDAAPAAAAAAADDDEITTTYYVRAFEGDLLSLRNRADRCAARRAAVLNAELAELSNQRRIDEAIARAVSDAWITGYLERALGTEISIERVKEALDRLRREDERRLAGGQP